MINLQKYIKEGITIEGNPKEGYEIFTIPTQHFRVKLLEELTPERFELEIKNHNKSQDLLSEIFNENYNKTLHKNVINELDIELDKKIIDYMNDPNYHN